MSFWKKLTLVCLTGATVFTWYVVFAESHAGLLVRMFDVGQGDSIFIQTENGNQILIDGGPGDAALAQLGAVLPFYDRTIDLVVLTHPHADHLNGLVEVLKRYRVDIVLETGVNHSISEYSEWHRLLKEKNVRVVLAKKGQRIKLSDAAYLDVFTPFKDFTDKSPKNIHDAMIVLKLTYGSTSALFMGDAERSLEYQLLFSGISLESDILKVAHHGSKTSSTEEFLRAVTPDVALVSAGRNNRYGHPAADILDRFKNLGIPVRRTDIEGALTLRAFPDGTYVIQ